MNTQKDQIKDCVKRILREDAELAAEKNCRHERENGLCMSHGTLTRVESGEFPDLDKVRLTKEFIHLYAITVNLRKHVRYCDKRQDKTGADVYRARIREYGKSILRACGLSINDLL